MRTGPLPRGSVTAADRQCSPEERLRRLASLARRLSAISQRLAREAQEQRQQE
jgi:hypothetical protein